MIKAFDTKAIQNVELSEIKPKKTKKILGEVIDFAIINQVCQND